MGKQAARVGAVADGGGSLGVKQLIAAVRQAVADHNPYAALSLALTLPDICASLEASDGKTNGARYAAWWDIYLLTTYTRMIGYPPEKHVFLTGGDCYALRCAVLHQGLDDTTAHRARDALSKFHFVQPRNDSVVHLNQVDSALNLQVDIFCDHICRGTEAWLRAMSGRSDVDAGLAKLITIADLANGFRF